MRSRTVKPAGFAAALTLVALILGMPAWASHSVTTAVVPNACNGSATATATAVVTGGSGVFSYQWNTIPIQSVATAAGLTAGTYLVVVTDVIQGDQVPGFAIVADPPALEVSTSGSAALCFDQCSGSASTIVSGGTPGYTYLWSNGASTPALTGQCAGQVRVTVTDSRGCKVASSTTIGQPPAIVPTHATQITSAPHLCDGVIELSVGGGTPPFGAVSWSYQMTPVGTLPDNCSTTPECISRLADACAGNYRAVFSDSNGCSSEHDVVLAAGPDAVFYDGFE